MKIAIAIIHGMGTQDHGFSHPLQRGIAKAYDKLGLSFRWSDLIFKEIVWSDLLAEKQKQLFQRVNYRQDLNFLAARAYLIDYLSDVVAYQSAIDENDDAVALRTQIHQRVDDSLSQFSLRDDTEAVETPLVLIGHSLGSVILFNYLWESQCTRGLCPFRRGDTLTGFISMGSPMALWALRHPEFGKPFIFPGTKVPSTMRESARWYNFYDKDDILAYPLKALNDDFDRAVSEDISVNVGGLLTQWNPFSHMGYWNDADVHRQLAAFLARLQAGRQEG